MNGVRRVLRTSGMVGGLLAGLVSAAGAGEGRDAGTDPAGWARTVATAVINPAGRLEDYPVRVAVSADVLTEASFPEAHDVRFFDPAAGRMLPHWRQGREEDRWVFWVKPEALPGHSRLKLVVLSGKPQAKDASDPRAVFPFFDGFEGAQLDTSTWEVSARRGKVSTRDGRLHLAVSEKIPKSVAEVVCPLAPAETAVVEARMRGSSLYRGGLVVTDGDGKTLFADGVGSELGIHRGMFYFHGGQGKPEEGTWYRLRYALRGMRAEGTVLSDEGVAIISRAARVRAGVPRMLRLGAWQDTDGDPALSRYEVDWVRVRPVRYPEPYAELGGRFAEEQRREAEVAESLVLTFDPLLEGALEISKADVLAARTVKAGAVGFVPGGQYDGIWLTDCTFLLEAYRFWGPQYRDFLYSEAPGREGIVPRFAGAQDTDGTIPMVFWGATGEVDYGGQYDIAQNRKQHRNMESPYTFVHLNAMYWRDTGDVTFLRQYRTAMRRGMEPIDRRRDPDTGLILATYGPPNSDVCVDYALPRTTAHPYFNALYVRAYLEYAEIAEALGDGDEAEVYRARGRALREAINRHLWVPSRRRYETRICRTPVSTDPELPASGVKEDTRFPVVDNMQLMYYGIPDAQEKIEGLIAEIDKSEEGLAVVGQMVEPHYPDGFLSRAYAGFNGGNYLNGDVWTWFSNRYATALYRAGYPERADHVLWSQARVAVRDQGFSEHYEDDATGRAKGAFHYSTTAASFQLAVVEGLFGIRLDVPRRRLWVHPSLSRSGKLRLRLGGKPAEVALDVDPDRRQMHLRLQAGFRGKGDFRILISKAVKGEAPWSVARETAVGHEDVGARRVRRGNASYVAFGADLTPGAHVFRLRQR